MRIQYQVQLSSACLPIAKTPRASFYPERICPGAVVDKHQGLVGGAAQDLAGVPPAACSRLKNKAAVERPAIRKNRLLCMRRI
jgi:hypothetical protein